MKMRLLLATAIAGGALTSPAAFAEQDPFLGQVSITAATYCPVNWVEADGQVLTISSNPALFALFGCRFGGDCSTNFAVPDLRGRSPVRFSAYKALGDSGGVETQTLSVSTLPSHSHQLYASNTSATLPSPTGNDLGEFLSGGIPGYSSDPIDPNVELADGTIGVAGNASPAPFSIRQPSLGMRFCVATDGLFPPRN